MTFIFDIDNTIFHEHKEKLNEANGKAIRNLIDNGHEVIIATARQAKNLEPLIKLDLIDRVKLVASNGAYIRDNDKLELNPIYFEDLADLKGIIRNGNYPSVFISENYYGFTPHSDGSVPMMTNFINQSSEPHNIDTMIHVNMVYIYAEQSDLLENKLNQLYVDFYYCPVYKNYIICKRGINKQTGVRSLTSDEYIAFGDDLNDIDLFKGSVRAYCVGENQELKHFADKVIAPEELPVILSQYLIQ